MATTTREGREERARRVRAKVIGGRMRALREMRGLSLREAALLADVEKAALCRIELGHWGKTGPGVHTIAKVCEALGESMADVFRRGAA